MLNDGGLLEDFARGLIREASVKSAVLFGSRARDPGAAGASDAWSDIDLHVITSRPQCFEERPWVGSLCGRRLDLHVTRPASGGVRKTTLLYEDGEVDVVVISRLQMNLARWATACGLHRRVAFLRRALNEMSTIMRGGYRFLKGEPSWGRFYAKVTADLPGERLDAAAIGALADTFLCDYLWVRQKIARGELIAAQRGLHRSLTETNFRLLHEWRLRCRLRTFREARRLEDLLTPAELIPMRFSARLSADELQTAADQALDSLERLATGLDAAWHLPPEFPELVRRAVKGW